MDTIAPSPPAGAPARPATAPPASAPVPAPTGLGAPLLERTEWDDALLDAEGVPVEVVDLVTVGGGLGSFALVDQLRIRGKPAAEIAVVAPSPVPYAEFRRFARNSQLPDAERIRSDSATRIDNPWGFPSYAMSEAFRSRRVGPLLRVLVEPVLAEHYGPRADLVYAGIDREAARIGWSTMVRPGTALAVRPRTGGGFFVAYRPAPVSAGDGSGTPGVGTPAPADGPVGPRSLLAALRSRDVHVAVGHPVLNAAPEPDGTGTRHVHAYDPHDSLYADVAEAGGGTVVVRGAGIAASQVIHRLLTERAELGLETTVVHVVRTPGDAGGAQVLQPFSAPRSAFGGQLHRRLGRTRGERRLELLHQVRRTSTPARRIWRRTLEEAQRRGCYIPVTGAHPELTADARWVVDCTGFAEPGGSHPLLADIARWCRPEDTADAGMPPALSVDRACAVEGSRRPDGGAVYLSGAAASEGGVIGPVDSFWGLAYGALLMADDLARSRRHRRLGPLRSVRAWLRWVRGARP